MDIEGLVAIIMSLGLAPAIIWIRAHFKLRERQLALAEKQAVDKKLLDAAQKEKEQLEARIQNLEAIVCSVDFELNQRLNKLAAAESQKMHLLTAGATVAQPAGGTKPAQSQQRLGQLTVGETVLGRYAIERELGRGGMGAVYLARDSKLGERVALKTITAVYDDDPDELLDRMRREVQAARKVTHPNVIRIHDLTDEGPLLFLSMEFVDGETLGARVKRLGPLPIAEAVETLVAVSSGVGAAHAAGVVHRDLKPTNVLIAGDRQGRVVKVIDFGLAKTRSQASMTATGLILGTPEYMAPEQVRGQRIDARTDVYALGALAFYLLTGRPPFAGDTPIAIGFAQVHDAPTSPRKLRPEIPAALDELVLRALSKTPADRPVDAGALLDALKPLA